MDLLQDYDSSEEQNDEDSKEQGEEKAVVPVPLPKAADRRFLHAAPTVSLTMRTASSSATSTALTTYKDSSSERRNVNKRKQGDLVLMNNPTKAVMYQPVQGPQAVDESTAKKVATKAEHNVAFDEATFGQQRTAFQRTGRALAPNEEGSVILRTTLGYDPKRLEYFAAKEEERRKRPRPVVEKKKDLLVVDSDDEVTHGVWAPPSQEEQWEADNALSDLARGGLDALAPEQRAEREYLTERDRQRGIEQDNKAEESSFERLVERKMAHLLPPKMASETPSEATTTFHGSKEVDYKGQSWLAPPAGLGAVTADGELEMDHHKCFVPKKCVFRFTGHSKGVQRIRLFPRTGHLILSGGLDGKCKVWSVKDKRVMRTYEGHTAGVRDVQFNHSGTKFVSASFDRFLRLWDTESGEVLQTFTNKKVPYVVKFYPLDDNFFVVGCSDNKIVTYDATTAEITQEYNHHLAPVNAIVFVEDHGTKMVSSSDDKKILVWEWDIGVPIKYISDPTMHSMPCLALHPSHQFFVGQSLDNTICVFQAVNRFALQRKKKFSGHVVSGYACEMDFSPDGRYLVSGDGNGNLFFWDWKKHKIMQKYKAHSAGPAICTVWHPLEPSTIFTCGWDGVVKMWQ